MKALKRGLVAAGVTAVVVLAVIAYRNREPAIIGDIPAQIADSTFWRMFSTMSEPNGTFRSDNFVSNETTFQYVIPDLRKTVGEKGVYIGVGPDQNFTYLVAFQPRIAFIVDIRRQNAMLHLMYKSIIERAADRAEFLSMLFSRERPEGLDSNSTVGELLEAFEAMPVVQALHDSTVEQVARHLRTTHGFALTNGDVLSIEYVHSSFANAGPGLTYTALGGRRTGYRGGGNFGNINGMRMPSYATLMEADDGRGEQRSYIASEKNFRVLKDLETRNLIIPLVGDFGGDHALKSVGLWLKQRGARVSVFYTSNVEQYLFQDDSWRRFYQNVSTLPLDRNSTFIRSAFNRMAGRLPGRVTGSPAVQLTLPITQLLDSVRGKRVGGYDDVIRMSMAATR